MRAIEVGCGTGSSTAAFARMFRTVDAFEIDIPSCEAAKRRLDILGLHNATIHHTLPELQGEAIRTAAQDPVHIFILFAVLEHMTISERIATLQLAKETLAPGGLLVIGETPNRLTYFDSHTSRLPFFHMLPDELAIHYIDRSPRAGLVRTMQSAREKSLEAAIERRIRAGTGVSYHEFEVALGHQVHGQIVLSGYEPEIIASQDSALEEALLRTYYTAMAPGIHEAFARAFLYFVLRMN